MRADLDTAPRRRRPTDPPGGGSLGVPNGIPTFAGGPFVPPADDPLTAPVLAGPVLADVRRPFIPRIAFDSEAAQGIPAPGVASAPSAPDDAPGYFTREGMEATRREDAQRMTLAGLLAAVPAGLGLAFGAESGIGSALMGVGAGFGAGARQMDERQTAALQQRAAAFAQGLRDNAQARAAAARDELQNTRADNRQTAADAAADARREADRTEREARDRRSTIEASAKAALEAGDTDAYLSFADQLGIPEDAARSLAETYAADAARADVIQDRDYGLRRRGVAATEAGVTLRRLSYEADRADEAWDRAHPPASRSAARPPAAAPAARPAAAATAPPRNVPSVNPNVVQRFVTIGDRQGSAAALDALLADRSMTDAQRNAVADRLADIFENQ